jgi:membrane-bound lytic murein transglycosylase D
MPKRWVIQTAIISAGALVAIGTLERGHYTRRTPLVQQVSAGDSLAREKLSSLTSAAQTAGAVSLGGLDSGVNHPRVDYWVSKLSNSAASSFKVALGRMTKYADMIDTKLAAKGMPSDLKYLALIESEFNPNARSRVAAVGMWQFMKPTAKQYGLVVGKKVDERKNPARATDAAVTYLSKLHDRLGSWYLAAAAYNSGEGTVMRALKKVTGKTEGTDADFFRIMHALPKETQDYVPKLIAAARIGNDPERYGIDVDSVVAVANKPVKATKAVKSTKSTKSTKSSKRAK